MALQLEDETWGEPGYLEVQQRISCLPRFHCGEERVWKKMFNRPVWESSYVSRELENGSQAKVAFFWLREWRGREDWGEGGREGGQEKG